MLGIGENVKFSKGRIDFNEMRSIYSACDTVLNRSSNEGFGLSTLEAMMCGKPIIAIKTGGLTRQVEDLETGEQYGIALEPDVRSLVGNQVVPFIYEDLISHEKLANALLELYEWGPEKRRDVGLRALEHAHKDYSLNDITKKWDESLTKLLSAWENKRQRWEIKTL
jgi:glycosyltransferase involved in cell wall biosynthesis